MTDMVPVFFGRRVLFVRISLGQAGIHSKLLTAHQSLSDAPSHSRLEQMAQQIAIAETTVSVFGERRMVRHPISQIEAAEPAICKVQMNFFAEPAFGPNAKAISNQQHADKQFRINRRPAGVAIKRGEMLADAVEFNKAVDGSQQMVLWDVILNRELIKQSALCLLLRSQHRNNPLHPQGN